MKGWWNESIPHAKAAKGITTKPLVQKHIKTGTGNQTAVKYKLDDNIQNDMHALDKNIRKATTSSKPEVIKEQIDSAIKTYGKLTQKIADYKHKYGELPHWVNYTWHGKEQFGENGNVFKLMNKLRNAKSMDELKNYQVKLYNEIKLPRDKQFNEVYK